MTIFSRSHRELGDLHEWSLDCDLGLRLLETTKPDFDDNPPMTKIFYVQFQTFMLSFHRILKNFDRAHYHGVKAVVEFAMIHHRAIELSEISATRRLSSDEQYELETFVGLGICTSSNCGGEEKESLAACMCATAWCLLSRIQEMASKSTRFIPEEHRELSLQPLIGDENTCLDPSINCDEREDRVKTYLRNCTFRGQWKRIPDWDATEERRKQALPDSLKYYSVCVCDDKLILFGGNCPRKNPAETALLTLLYAQRAQPIDPALASVIFGQKETDQLFEISLSNGRVQERLKRPNQIWPKGRSLHSGCVVPGRKLMFVAGGKGGPMDDGPFQPFWSYDWLRHRWHALPSPPYLTGGNSEDLTEGDLVSVGEDFVVLVGSLESLRVFVSQYDIRRRRWTRLFSSTHEDILSLRCPHAFWTAQVFVMELKGKPYIYVMDGCAHTSNGPLQSIYKIDSRINLTLGEFGRGPCWIREVTPYQIPPEREFTLHNSLWRFDIRNRVWERVTPLGCRPLGRGEGGSCVVRKNRVIFLGGYSHIVRIKPSDIQTRVTRIPKFAYLNDMYDFRPMDDVRGLSRIESVSAGFFRRLAQSEEEIDANPLPNVAKQKLFVGSDNRLYRFGGYGFDETDVSLQVFVEPEESKKSVCNYCFGPGGSMGGKCPCGVNYCSRECQKREWRIHRRTCSHQRRKKRN